MFVYPFSKFIIQVLLTTLCLGSQDGIYIPIGHAINLRSYERILAAGCLYRESKRI